MTVKLGPLTGTLTDITAYIKFGGLSWSYNSIDANGSGRNIDGEMQRTLVAIKGKYEISCVPLTTTQKSTLSTLLSNQWLKLQVITTTGTEEMTVYPGSTIKSSFLMVKDNQELWDGFAFSLIQK